MPAAADETIHTAPPPRARLFRSAIAAGAVVLVGLAAGYGGWTLRPEAPRIVTRFALTLGDVLGGPGFHMVALSPDGRRLVYAASTGLYLRAFDKLDAAPIAGLQGATPARSPFFSPDGQWVGFWQDGQLKKVSVSGGAPVTICTIQSAPLGVTWAADNTILIGQGPGGIWRVSGDGGTPEPIVMIDAGQRAHGPQLLPDGRSVLFTLARNARTVDEAEIVVQSLESGTRKTLITGGTDARYVASGHLVYALRVRCSGFPSIPGRLPASAVDRCRWSMACGRKPALPALRNLRCRPTAHWRTCRTSVSRWRREPSRGPIARVAKKRLRPRRVRTSIRASPRTARVSRWISWTPIGTSGSGTSRAGR